MIGSRTKKSDSISQQKNEISNYFIKNDWKSLDEVRKILVSNVKLCNFSLQRNRIDLRCRTQNRLTRRC